MLRQNIDHFELARLSIQRNLPETRRRADAEVSLTNEKSLRVLRSDYLPSAAVAKYTLAVCQVNSLSGPTPEAGDLVPTFPKKLLDQLALDQI